MKKIIEEELTHSMDVLQFKTNNVKTPTRKRNINSIDIVFTGKTGLDEMEVIKGNEENKNTESLIDDRSERTNKNLSIERITKRSKSPTNRGKLKDLKSIEEEFKLMSSENNLTKSKSLSNLNELFPTGAKYSNKNRYNNVFPTESTRVKLKVNKKKDFFCDDYINANFINDFESENKKPKFISSQAPLSNTFNDFYKMIWQENSTVIVCLTNMEEKGKKKAEKYFPELGENSISLYDFEISFVSQSKQPSFTIYFLDLLKTKNRKTRRISLIHYFEWPDMGKLAIFFLFFSFSSFFLSFKFPKILFNSFLIF